MHILAAFFTFMAGSIFGVAVMCIMQISGRED